MGIYPKEFKNVPKSYLQTHGSIVNNNQEVRAT